MNRRFGLDRAVVLALGVAIASGGQFAAAAADGPAVLPPDGKEAFEPERLQRLVTDGDESWVVATFKRYPGRVLPFIDSYLEGGLAMIEKDGAAAEDRARASFRTGVRFAKLADQAFGGTHFSDYATAFASWSPEERIAFREGQRLHGEGRALLKQGDAKAALAAFDRSFRLADGLRDAWGRAMATAGRADALAASGDPDSLRRARGTGGWAERQYNDLRLSESIIAVRLALAGFEQRVGAERGASTNERSPHVGHLEAAWSTAQQDPSVSAVAALKAAERLETALVEGGPAFAEALADLRRERALRVPSTPASGAAPASVPAAPPASTGG
jgi:hypothetical protein